MKKTIGYAFAGAASALAILCAVTPASADPITCPPGQVATLNPSDGGWICVNNGGNTNLSEDPKNPNADKGDFAH
jgi:hypothetical protein